MSQRRQAIDLSFTEPYFLDRDLAAGFDLFRSRTDFQSESSYDETSTGGTLRMGYPLTENLRHSVRYTLRDDQIQNVDDDASIFIKDEEGERSTRWSARPFPTTGATCVSCRPRATISASTKTSPALAVTIASSATR